MLFPSRGKVEGIWRLGWLQVYNMFRFLRIAPLSSGWYMAINISCMIILYFVWYMPRWHFFVLLFRVLVDYLNKYRIYQACVYCTRCISFGAKAMLWFMHAFSGGRKHALRQMSYLPNQICYPSVVLPWLKAYNLHSQPSVWYDGQQINSTPWRPQRWTVQTALPPLKNVRVVVSIMLIISCQWTSATMPTTHNQSYWCQPLTDNKAWWTQRNFTGSAHRLTNMQA